MSAPMLLSAVSSGAPLLDRIHHCPAEQLLAALPDGSIDMIITSPPYDNLRTYKGYTWQFEAIAHQMYRVLKSGGVAVWVAGDSVVDGSETLSSFKQALYFKESVGFNVHDTMVYQKDSLQFPDVSRYYQCFEYMFVLSKGAPRVSNLQRVDTTHFNNSSSTKRMPDGSLSRVEYKTGNETRVLENVWKFGVGNGKTTLDKIAFLHPAMFPEELARRHILTWSNPGDVVLDPFMGSGTTAKVARNLSRHYIGCDISAEYVTLAKRRLADTDPYQATAVAPGVTQHSLFEGLAS